MRIIREMLLYGYESISYKKIKSPQKIMKVIMYLESHYMKEISLDILAQTFGLSQTNLCRVFKEATGVTIYTYIINKRIENSIRILRTTNLAITDAAIESGFSDISFYNKKFKEKTSLTPRDFRKLYQK